MSAVESIMDRAPRLEEQVCFALYSASRSLTAAYRSVLEPLGLTYPQYLVMLALWEEDGVTVRNLGERLHLDSGTLSPLLKRLESRGLISRHRASDDERRLLVSLTDSGSAMRAHTPEIQKCILDSTGLSLPDLMTLHSLASRVVANANAQ